MRKIYILAILVTVFLTNINAQVQLAEFGDYQLENGAILKDAKIAYQTYGELNESKSNVILFPTWYGGTGESLKPYIGKDAMLDTTKFYIIVVDALGSGTSSSPSNSEVNSVFPEFSIGDMVNLQHQLLTKKLDINHLYAVTGISMGGMQTYQWMASYPEFFDKAIPIVGSWKLSIYDQLNYEIFKNVLEDEIKGQLDHGTHTMLEYSLGLTPDYFKEISNTIDEYLKELHESNSYNAKDLHSQMIAISNFNPKKYLQKNNATSLAEVFKGRSLIIYSSTDRLVSPDSNIIAINALKSESLDLKSVCGHYAFGCDIDRISEVVNRFLGQ